MGVSSFRRTRPHKPDTKKPQPPQRNQVSASVHWSTSKADTLHGFGPPVWGRGAVPIRRAGGGVAAPPPLASINSRNAA